MTQPARDQIREDRASLYKALREVILVVGEARNRGIGRLELADEIVSAAKTLIDNIRGSTQDPTQPIDPLLTRFVLEFCTFTLQDFPAVLDQPFDRMRLHIRFETGNQDIDRMYEHQDAWAADWLFRLRPEFFVDIGSRVCFVAIVSRVVPCVGVDARPTPLQMDNLDYRTGEGQALPFEDDSVPALTSLHAIEHFGLGRYGDTLDNTGWTKAFAEIQRVLKPDGWAFISVPVMHHPTIIFNSMRALNPEMIRAQFPGWKVEDELCLCPTPVSQEELARKLESEPNTFGTYCGLFRKPNVGTDQ